MKRLGQIVLTPLPYTDLSGAKLRPVLMLRQASARFDDWLVCMVSAQLHRAEVGFDEIVASTDADFGATGLKVPGVLRLSRLAVLDGAVLAGSLGMVGDERLRRVLHRLARWIESGTR